MTATGMLLGLRYDGDTILRLLQGVRGMEDNAFVQIFVNKGIDRGRIQEARSLLFLLGENKFGQPNPEIESQIRSVEDIVRLEEMAKRLLSASTWDEVLQ